MNNRITSAKNPLIRHVRQLAGSAKYRSEHWQTVLDGIHLCEAYLQAGLQPKSAVVSSESLQSLEVESVVSRLHGVVEVIEVPGSLFERISSLENGVGLLFIIDIPKPLESTGLQGDALLLDTVQDPGNVGTLLRTAAAAGVGKVYLSSGTASAWSPKVLRAGMGAHFTLGIYEDVDLQSVVKDTTVTTLATSLRAKSTVYQKDLKGPVAWLFGSEGRGVSPELLDLCDDTVIIPQESGVESLNVAASAAVCLFEQRRQRVV